MNAATVCLTLLSYPLSSLAAPATPAEDMTQFGNFADLGHYAEIDRNLAPPKATQPRVVFIGDSITELWAVLDPDFFAHPGFVNRGIGGQTTPQMLLRFHQDVVALKPVLVHIMAGTNDIAGNTGPTELSTIEANIMSMVDLARANGIGVVLGSVLPAQEFSWRPGLDPGPKIVALNRWLKTYAERRQLTFIDYHSALNDGGFGPRADLAPDGVHPSLAGYQIMDGLARSGIRSALTRRPNTRPLNR